jgi:serine acetyltransferase
MRSNWRWRSSRRTRTTQLTQTLDPRTRSPALSPLLCRRSEPPSTRTSAPRSQTIHRQKASTKLSSAFRASPRSYATASRASFTSLGAPLLARIVAEVAHALAGVDIHPGGEAFFIDHGTGVVIGETAVIGRNVRIYQAVTLGAKRFEICGNGELRKGYPRHPIVEDDVVIYAGATILGRVTIGRGSSIGGNVWLTESVPPRSRITQAKTQANEGGHSA